MSAGRTYKLPGHCRLPARQGLVPCPAGTERWPRCSCIAPPCTRLHSFSSHSLILGGMASWPSRVARPGGTQAPLARPRQGPVTIRHARQAAAEARTTPARRGHVRRPQTWSVGEAGAGNSGVDWVTRRWLRRMDGIDTGEADARGSGRRATGSSIRVSRIFHHARGSGRRATGSSIRVFPCLS